MALQLPQLDSSWTESDVEQKIVMPFLLAEEPFGLGLNKAQIYTKHNTRRFTIGKGADRKVYFPDYLIVVDSLPLVVIEVKAPNEGVEEAYREARLYAAELNANFPTGINPLTQVVATNGNKILLGKWDEAKPEIEVPYEDLKIFSESAARLCTAISRTELSKKFLQLSKHLRPDRLWKPRRMLGGVSIEQEEVPRNTFGSTMATEFAHIFNPSSTEDRIQIARKGYIPSRRRERYIDPIDRVIRASRPPSEMHSTPIEDTAAPREVIGLLKSPKPLEHQVLLLVGGVGVGKSTFVDYLQHVALPRDVSSSTISNIDPIKKRIDMRYIPEN